MKDPEILEYELDKAQETLFKENEAYGRLMDDLCELEEKLANVKKTNGYAERRKIIEQIVSDWDLFRNSEGGNYFTRNEQDDILDQLISAGHSLLCPMWMCGGTLIPIERNNWQGLVCDNCGAIYQFLRFDSKIAKTPLPSSKKEDER